MTAKRQLIRPKLVVFFHQQQSYIAVAVAIYAALWAVGIRAAVGPLLVYTLCLCNFTVALQDRLDSFCGQCRPPRRWLIFAAFLLVLSPIFVMVVNLVEYHLLKTRGQSLWQFLESGWKMPLVATVIFGMSSQLYRTTRSRLELQNRELQRKIEVEVAERDLQGQELQQAREIQQSLLPKEMPHIAGFEIDGAWEPARVVGGDYFDVIKLSATKLGICIADVVGKSVSAALLMANVQASVRAFASEASSPSSLCTRVNSVLCANIASGKFVTLFYGVLDAEHNLLQYTNAGHPCPILMGARGESKELENGGALLGVFPDWKYEDSVARLAAGDRLLLFTDGITEASGRDGEEFGEERLIRLMRAHAGESASALKATLLTEVRSFCASQFSDDATLIVVAALDASDEHGSKPTTTHHDDNLLVHTS
ncbi:MAG TPA: PP2C family protein-serine/threonine phosphatase [Candidatus Eremiobacteraceae bacterium]|nr:PP2C family protein-serine/threonine phosphatase [Candidatus Eremiobacteraceae bacterium]